ncbi:hypothetical protein [Thermococcus sp. 21S7]|uniref:hypothetical protein n=1 Tax=Thermococcus sp. 21S7 TaxID=1638221 RepID=UPI00143CBDC6|nr:hypothetical protein [Thermococcus sp. 21S7]NJE61902.1 hypothetical protein [Thermococcus sp. 21S7]
MSNVIANMTCMDSAIPYDGSTTCKVMLLNAGRGSPSPQPRTVSVSVSSVDLGTVHNAWAKSYQRGIEVDPIKVTLPPNDDKEIDVKIDLRVLAQDFWGNDHFAYKFAEHKSYMITVHFDNGVVVSDILTIKDTSENQNAPLIVKAGGIVGGILGGVISGVITRNPEVTLKGAVVGWAIGTAATWTIVSLSWKIYALYEGVTGISGDGDNNAVVGG